MLVYFEKIKSILTKKNLIILFSIGIILMSFSNFAANKDFESDKSKSSSSNNAAINKNELETRLKRILCNIKGAGKVEVMIVFDSDYERVVAKNTKSSVKNGGDENEARQTDTETVMEKSGNNQTPYLLKEINPSVRGVLVVAEGADSDSVKMDIKNAVKTVLGISMHKVEVMPKNQG